MHYVRRTAKTKIRVDPLVDGNGTLKASSEDVCEELNLYFASVLTENDTASILGEKKFAPGDVHGHGFVAFIRTLDVHTHTQCLIA